MFEMVDQFIYIAAALFAGYLALYRKSRAYAGIMLLAAGLLSNIMLIAFFTIPFILIALPITAVLLVNDWVADFRLGQTSTKHKIGFAIAILIFVYDIAILFSLSSFALINSFQYMVFGSIVAIITSCYLIFYPFKQVVEDRRVNVAQVKYNNMQLENNQKKSIEMDGFEQAEVKFTKPDSNKVDIRKVEYYTTPFGFDVKVSNLLFSGVVVLIIISLLLFRLFSYTTIDMKDYVFVYNPISATDGTIEYYASFEHFDQNNFYDELISVGSEQGLSDSDIKLYTPYYTEENEKIVKGLDPVVAFNPAIIESGGEVTVNITYNSDYARKHRIKVLNSNFVTKFDQVNGPITNATDEQYNQALALAQEKLTQSDYYTKYDLKNESVTYSKDSTDELGIIASFEVDGGILGKSKQIDLRFTPYVSNGQIKISDDIEKI